MHGATLRIGIDLGGTKIEGLALSRDGAEVARRRFPEARTSLAAMAVGDRTALRPAVIMMAVYSRLLDRLVAGGWRQLEPPVKLPRAEKMWIALRHGVL